MKTISPYPVRIPNSIRVDAERLAAEDGMSLDQFIVTALAEKVASLRTAEFINQEKKRIALANFDRLMNRQGGEPPRPGDELPEGYEFKKP